MSERLEEMYWNEGRDDVSDSRGITVRNKVLRSRSTSISFFLTSLVITLDKRTEERSIQLETMASL